MKKRLRIIIPLAVIIIAAAGYYYFTRKQDNRTSTTVSGNIEVTEIKMSFQIPGRLKTRLVDEGDPVTAGQLIATLDDTDELLAVAKAQAALNLAGARLAELTAGYRKQDIEAARANLDRALAAEKTAAVQYIQAKSDFIRYKALFKTGGISKKEYDLYNTRYLAADNGRAEAKARVTSAKEQLNLMETGPRHEDIAQAKAQVDVAGEELKLAKQRESYTRLYAPINGVVLSKAAEPGEYLNPASPVLTIGDTAHPWLRAYIREADLGRIALKQKALVSTDSFPGKTYPGRIVYISDEAEFTPKSVQTFEERVKLMYRIKIQLSNKNNDLKPGMPADATIDLRKN